MFDPDNHLYTPKPGHNHHRKLSGFGGDMAGGHCTRRGARALSAAGAKIGACRVIHHSINLDPW
ncbi:hypothetical protein ABZP36_035312 [Zizania latifolia]